MLRGDPWPAHSDEQFRRERFWASRIVDERISIGVFADAEVAERQRLLDHLDRLTPQPGAPVTTSNTTIVRAIPKLASLDLDQTQRFWSEKLGFERLFTYPDYGISGRDGVQIHFWLTDDADIPKETGCRIDVTGVDVLYAEMDAAGLVHPNGELADTPWGFRQFSVLDGDGNLVTFGERVEKESAPTE